MKYNNLLIGKWEAVVEYDYVNDEWIPLYLHESTIYSYTFDKEFFVVNGNGYYDKGVRIPYEYNPIEKTIQTPESSIPVCVLTENELVLEEIINLLSEIRMRIAFKKVR